MHKILPSRFDAIAPCMIDILSQLQKELAVDDETAFNIKLALEETITNAIKHGNKLNPALNVDVTIFSDGSRLTIKIKDQGQGFDFKNVPDPTQKDRLLMTSGRGVFLIRKLMDHVNYSDGGREVCMVKVLSDKVSKT